jgi:hypothetical protein
MPSEEDHAILEVVRPLLFAHLSTIVAEGHLNRAGIEFIDENGGGPGVRLRKRHQKKS